MTLNEKIIEIANSIETDNQNVISIQKDGSIKLEIDSITFIKLVVALEEYFNIEFDDDSLDIAKFPTVNSLSEYIKQIKPELS